MQSRSQGHKTLTSTFDSAAQSVENQGSTLRHKAGVTDFAVRSASLSMPSQLPEGHLADAPLTNDCYAFPWKQCDILCSQYF